MKITIIGAGAMGGAMAEGLLQSEKFTPSDITVSDHNQPVLDHFASKGASVTLDNQLACHGADIVCVMPNIAIAYKQSMTFITPIDASATEIQQITDIFDELGESLIMEERLFPAATAMSCAIAYAMRYVRANVEGGVEMGFKAKDAQKIVLQTVKGAVELLQATGEHPEAAIDKVTTPGGCTIKGLNTMEQNGFTNAVIKGLIAGKK